MSDVLTARWTPLPDVVPRLGPVPARELRGTSHYLVSQWDFGYKGYGGHWLSWKLAEIAPDGSARVSGRISPQRLDWGWRRVPLVRDVTTLALVPVTWDDLDARIAAIEGAV